MFWGGNLRPVPGWLATKAAIQRFAFYLKHSITLTGEAVACETTTFAGQGDTKSNAKHFGLRIIAVSLGQPPKPASEGMNPGGAELADTKPLRVQRLPKACLVAACRFQADAHGVVKALQKGHEPGNTCTVGTKVMALRACVQSRDAFELADIDANGDTVI